VIVELETPAGLARIHLHITRRARAALVLGHGAGGGVGARDIVAASDVALSEGLAVALVEQPYRVAGRRAPAPATQLDAAWIAAVERLRADELAGVPLVTGGRSLGARVACRTAHETSAVAVLCLAFPLVPPRRRGDASASRLPELDAVSVPVLVVQGASDPFGIPPPAPTREVATVRGTHSLTADLDAVSDAVRTWLRAVVPVSPKKS